LHIARTQGFTPFHATGVTQGTIVGTCMRQKPVGLSLETCEGQKERAPATGCLSSPIL